MQSRIDWPGSAAGMLIWLLLSLAAFESAWTQIPESEFAQKTDRKTSFDNGAGYSGFAGWPGSELLIQEIDALAVRRPDLGFLTEGKQQLTELQSCQSNSGPNSEDRCAAEVIDRLAAWNNRIRETAILHWQARPRSESHETLAKELGRLHYRMLRRIDVWQRINERMAANSDWVDHRSHRFAGHAKIRFDQVDPGWRNYLLVEEVETAFNSLNSDPALKRQVARKCLAKIHSPILNQKQVGYLQKSIDPTALSSLKSHAAEPADFGKLLSDLEQFESRPTGYHGFLVNDHYQNLIWSNDPGDLAIANELDKHYRNANFRMTLSSELINRLIPQMPKTTEPFSEQMMGAQVVGQNDITNRISIKLVPDPHRFNFQLETMGQVETRSVATRGGLKIKSLGQSDFLVQKGILLGHDGFDTSSRPLASCDANQALVGLNSNFDRYPLLGRVVRKVALQKIREQTGEAERLIENQVATMASERVQEIIEEEIGKVKDGFHRKLFRPMLNMELEPVCMEMKTEEDQIVLRQRLAGRDQMAAHTIRPSEAADSLLSIQLHQSAVNNAFSRIGLNGKKFNTAELTKHIHDILGIAPTKDLAGPSPDAEFEFASFDPVSVEFNSGRIIVTMKLNALKIGNGKRWRGVTLSAAYIPTVEGLQITLTQDDLGTQIRGYRLNFRDRASIGTVHKVVFKRDYSFAAMPEKIAEKIEVPDLRISQFEFSDGWAAVAVDNLRQSVPMIGAYSPHSELRNATYQSR